MKKFHLTHKILIVLCLAVSALLLFAACGSGSKLDKPSNLEFTNNNTLSWTAVSHSKGYTVDINGTRIDTRRTSVSITDYAPGKYTVKVKAIGNGEDYRDSEWAVIKFEKEYESGLTYTLAEDGRSYEITSVGFAKGDIVIDDEYRGLPVTSIGEYAFSNSNKVTSLVIGNNVTQIKAGAFYNCTQM
ncbi:MAG: leucine-rich repeat domain-containing protein, partial [Clostridiales bacterium]|nr:leucine-rich repeat domain-containing protein [Clostridiales bacterium]